MTGKVLAIEIGYSLTKAVCMECRGSSIKVLFGFEFETPVDMVGDGPIKPSETFRGLLRAECEQRQISVKNVIFSISSGAIASRVVEIPAVKDAKIAEVLMAGMDEYFPVDISQYQIAWKKLDTVTDAGNQKKIRINITIVPLETIGSYKALAKMCGLNLVELDFAGNSIFQLAKKYYQKNVNALIKIDDRGTVLTVIDNGHFELQRNIAYGIDDAVGAVIEYAEGGKKLTYREALTMIRHKTCIRQHLNEKEPYSADEDDPELRQIKIGATEALRPLVNNVARVLEYYTSQNQDVVFDNINIIGDGADFSGLTKLMSNELGQKVVALPNLDTMKDASAFLDEGTTISSYAVCIGAAIDPLKLLNPELAKTAKGEAGGKGGKEIALLPAFIVCGIGVVGAAAMIIVGMLSAGTLQIQKMDLQTKIAQTADAQSVYNEYNTAESRYQNYETMYSYTQNNNDQLRDFIAELEQKLPSDVNVISFNADKTGVSMSMNVTTKESAAKIIQELRTFTTIADVTTTGITETTQEGTAPTVSLSVTCTYPQAVAASGTTTSGTSSGTTDSTASTTTDSTASSTASGS